MSMRHWLKGQKRRARRAGLGRGIGNVGMLLEAQERQQRRETIAKARPVVAARVKRAKAAQVGLDLLIAQDQKRGKRATRGRKSR